MKIKSFIVLTLGSILMQGHALAKTKVGESPFSIDGYANEWKWVKEDRTDLIFKDLGVVVSHGLQEEGYDTYPYGSRVIHEYHDAIQITVDLEDRSNFLPKDIEVTIEYAYRDTGEFFPDSYKNSKMTARISASPNMVATGDVYAQAAAGNMYSQTIEFLFPERNVDLDAIPIITVTMTGTDNTVLKKIFNKKANLKPRNNAEFIEMASWWGDDEGYSVTVSVVGAVGPVAKGFQFSTNEDEYAVSVVDGFQAGDVASFQGEVAVWNTGNLNEIANGVTRNVSIATPIAGISFLSNQTGTIQGIGLVGGPAISLGVAVSRLESKELHRGAYWGYDPERMDRTRDRNDQDEDSDRNSVDRDRDDSDHDRPSRGGHDVIEHDITTGTTTEFDFPDDPVDGGTVGD
ncbi:hypothetical protein AAFX19_02575 [Vibrio harveyi]|jgi:hypothetical protein|uniref:hypothetical protein n=2 Tax=Vibrio harveyi TaxID=669 RepID=UPI00234DDEB7|nr:hypothetical protein [Vibrio harveyi]ELI6428515.1 hypothetical protein [Vibrio harveyi]WCP84156.1 hypothetical protein PQE20_27315 [Vibrio harveyi]